MICGHAQGLLIKRRTARSAKKINYYRRQLREHVKTCEYCQKMMDIKSLRGKIKTVHRAMNKE